MKVFNVLVNEVYNFETTNNIYSFLSKEDAEAKVKQLRDNYMRQVEPDDGYEITDEPALFDSYPDGCSGEEHYTIQIYECEVEGSGSTTDRSLAMRQMEQELIGIVRENGDDILPLEDLGMSWTEECDGECYTKDITDISIERTWDGDTVLNVCINGIDRIRYSDCDSDDLGHNLADYIYEEIKSYY